MAIDLRLISDISGERSPVCEMGFPGDKTGHIKRIAISIRILVVSIMQDSIYVVKRIWP